MLWALCQIFIYIMSSNPTGFDIGTSSSFHFFEENLEAQR